MSRADASVIVAVMVAGSAAGVLVDSVFWAATPLVAGLLAIASPARRRVTTEAQAFLPEFPDALRKVVSETADALTLGDTPRLLASVLQPARSLFASQQTAFDDRAEHELRASVSELVTRSCDLALELSRLDLAAPSSRAAAPVTERYQSARTLVVSRLERAAEARSELYASGVQHGTPASDRVAELADELRREAAVRGEAKHEVDAALGGDAAIGS